MEKLKIKGEPVKLVVYDTRGDNAEAINLTRKLIHSDKVLLVLGPFFSAECEVAFPIANQGKTPIVTAAAAKPGIAANNRPWAFRMALTSDKLNGPLVDRWQAANKGQIKKVVILTDTKDAFTKADGTAVFPAVLKAKGIEVIDNISFQTGDIDFSAQVTKVKGLNPDGIVIAGLYNEGGNVVREIRKQGLQQPVIGALGMSEAKFIEIAGPAGEGVMVVNPFWADNPDAEGRGLGGRVQEEREDAEQRRHPHLRQPPHHQAVHREDGRHQQAGRPRQGPRAHQGLLDGREGLPGHHRQDRHQRRRRRRARAVRAGGEEGQVRAGAVERMCSSSSSSTA